MIKEYREKLEIPVPQVTKGFKVKLEIQGQLDQQGLMEQTDRMELKVYKARLARKD